MFGTAATSRLAFSVLALASAGQLIAQALFTEHVFADALSVVPERNFNVFKHAIGRPVIAKPAAAGDRSYGLVIDAGSSGSRIYAFYWNSDSVAAANDKSVSVFPLMDAANKEQLATKIQPGLSTVKPAGVANYLQPLIQSALGFIPQNKHASTPLYLKATAGMRLLPTQEREAIIEATIAFFSDKSRVPFKFDPTFGAQVIPGEDEGVYGWLTANALDGRLNKVDSTGAKPMTAVALDLGGASTQVTFEPRFAPLDHAYRVRINSTTHVLYTHSYLRLGADVARQRYAAALLGNNAATQTGVPVLDSPCDIRGTTDQVTLLDGRTVQLKGTGQFRLCRKYIHDTLLGRQAFCAAPPCAINGIHIPAIPTDMPVYAASNFFHTTKDLGCGELSNAACVSRAAQDKCSRLDASNAMAEMPGAGKYINTVCFGAALSLELLNAYHIAPERPIHFVEKLNGRAMDWALGAMIDEVNQMHMAA
ncbi:nucleoside phosphatase GDA1/CD39 [Thamnocephalis sphaerospora]|uniref:guanosine-diphosphatase n=1 Tax=Thamnocephalis sphaerospora TaxID=78915 RepID=A0A4P9XQN5_9FUNG|nr:nucleoside phosphatase GDA1/CD39 [Thamnocephalis sphaerospora]|eukprot:RKP08355.1 nucleoside phosphatase GDA1/CD39 [Thamnocephalis sphaerospora]